MGDRLFVIFSSFLFVNNSRIYNETNNYYNSSRGIIIRLNYSSDSINTVDELIGIEITYQLIRHTKYGNKTIFLDDIVLERIFNSVNEITNSCDGSVV